MQGLINIREKTTHLFKKLFSLLEDGDGLCKPSGCTSSVVLFPWIQKSLSSYKIPWILWRAVKSVRNTKGYHTKCIHQELQIYCKMRHDSGCTSWVPACTNCYIEAKLGTDVGTYMVQKFRIKAVIWSMDCSISPCILTRNESKEQQSFGSLKLIWE